MPQRSTIFISAVSSELRSFRQAVRDVLLAKDVFPLVEDNFPTDYRDIRVMLEDLIRKSDAVICLVGFAFGGEPRNLPAGVKRRSYTQLEYDLTRELGKPVYVFITDDQVRPCDAVPQEDGERCRLQLDHRAALQSRNELWHSFKTLDELKLQVAKISDRRFLPREDQYEITVEPIHDPQTRQDDLWNAVELYSSRLPEEERYDNAELLGLIRQHLAGRFGPHRPSSEWKAYFFVAKQAEEVVGMLLAYEDRVAKFSFVPYLVARKAPRGKRGAPDISRRLLSALLDGVRQGGGPSRRLRFLTEVDDPVLSKDIRERKRRLARIKLFEQAAESLGLSLRCLDLAYVQPKLDPTKPALALRLLYCAEVLPCALNRSEVSELLSWLYTRLYSEDIFNDPDEGKKFAEHTRQLLEKALTASPDQVRLLRARQLLD